MDKSASHGTLLGGTQQWLTNIFCSLMPFLQAAGDKKESSIFFQLKFGWKTEKKERKTLYFLCLLDMCILLCPFRSSVTCFPKDLNDLGDCTGNGEGVRFAFLNIFAYLIENLYSNGQLVYLVPSSSSSSSSFFSWNLMLKEHQLFLY